MRAVIPGYYYYVNYFYKDGTLPTGTKSAFNEYKILTVHGIIATNTIISMSITIRTAIRIIRFTIRLTIRIILTFYLLRLLELRI